MAGYDMLHFLGLAGHSGCGTFPLECPPIGAEAGSQRLMGTTLVFNWTQVLK